VVQYYVALMTALKNREDEGQGLVEYALIIFLVSIAAMGTLLILGESVDGVFADINGAL
jgi:pilus assembly protein Flp/PilA